MSTSSLAVAPKKKDSIRKKLKKTYEIPEKTRAIIVSNLTDTNINHFLQEACEALDCTFLSKIPQDLIGGADAILLSGDESVDFLRDFLASGVVPILPKKSEIASYFESFNPMKFTGNAFLYKKNNSFLIFEKICGFLENRKYPGDKKILTKNIRATRV
ncbi:hypothetical protein CSB09_02700 [Candidatus Gracilibacteria bacterium]|nr:MAG: hypothetical protein CSB09_02700 [Candidatus Gracilibacteria bacterium]